MRDIFETYNLSELRKLASGYNKKVKIAGASKMKKPDLIDALMKHTQFFKDVKKKVAVVKPARKPTTKPPVKKEQPKPQPKSISQSKSAPNNKTKNVKLDTDIKKIYGDDFSVADFSLSTNKPFISAKDTDKYPAFGPLTLKTVNQFNEALKIYKKEFNKYKDILKLSGIGRRSDISLPNKYMYNDPPDGKLSFRIINPKRTPMRDSVTIVQSYKFNSVKELNEIKPKITNDIKADPRNKALVPDFFK